MDNSDLQALEQEIIEKTGHLARINETVKGTFELELDNEVMYFEIVSEIYDWLDGGK